MSRRTELEALSSQELHDRALTRARHHLDAAFLWRLMELLPVAETAAGKEGEADADIQHASAVVADAFLRGDARVQEALRPVFVDYLLEHPDA